MARGAPREEALENDPCCGPCQFGEHKRGNAGRCDARKTVGEHPSKRGGGVGKGRRGREPVSRADIGGDEPCNPVFWRAQHDEDKARCGHRFSQPLAPAATDVGGELEQIDCEHRVGEPGAQHGPPELHQDVGNQVRLLQLAPRCHDEAYGRIQMGTADRREYFDQHIKATHGRKRIGQERHAEVAPGKPLGHDARADHHSEQERAAQGLGEELLWKGMGAHQLRPIRSSSTESSASPSAAMGRVRSCSSR